MGNGPCGGALYLDMVVVVLNNRRDVTEPEIQDQWFVLQQPGVTKGRKRSWSCYFIVRLLEQYEKYLLYFYVLSCCCKKRGTPTTS